LKITADINILVRVTTLDDAAQANLAKTVLEQAELIALPVLALCEFVWVLARAYKIPLPEIAATIRTLIAAGNVVTNRPAVQAGLAMLDAGGDFADGVLAHEGAWLGGEIFLSFDKIAVENLQMKGISARLLA
jgi:predicted nucleic-acid-binding protein